MNDGKTSTRAKPGPDPRVPQAREERERLRALCRSHAAESRLVPPLTMEELSRHAAEVSALSGGNGYHDFLIVALANAVWRDTMATVPFERRLLLLPQCLRSREHCAAQIDEIGLLCEECGSCEIGQLQAAAEDLGYVVLVAEGSTVVTKLLEGGKVDAVVGVSCLEALEKSFPHMAANAIPGIAIPLLRNGCDETMVDVDWVREAVHLLSEGRWLGTVDLDRLRGEVRSWFERDQLVSLLGSGSSLTEEVALSWLSGEGKRWRPALAACAYRALLGADAEFPDHVRNVAVAVECFHKASLVHDDIEDDDDIRYGRMTLHKRHGVPVALNVGDLLLGEGYRLIAECGADDTQRARMLAVAAEGHRTLCLGQGEELVWAREPAPPSVEQVLSIFARKTAPAFEVALRLGAICAGADEATGQVLKAFSRSLGVAYQVRDDILDLRGEGADDDVQAMRPSLLVAMAYEHASAEERSAIEQSWQGTGTSAGGGIVGGTVASAALEDRARQMLEHYKNEAMRSLAPLGSAHLKSLLHKITGRILGGV